MAALTAARKIDWYGKPKTKHNMPVKAATKVFYGGTAVKDTGGVAAPGRTATGLIAVGIFVETIDNTAGAAGEKRVEIFSGTAKRNNSSAGDLIAQADLFTTCYIVDDQTVAKTDGGGTRSKCGLVEGVDADGVFVQIAGEETNL